jgi:hypothetical protein
MRVITMLRSLPAGAKRFAGEVRKEYAARMMDKALAAVERDKALYAQMSEAQRLEADADTNEILRRAHELTAKRRAAAVEGSYFARRAKAEARVRRRHVDAD